MSPNTLPRSEEFGGKVAAYVIALVRQRGRPGLEFPDEYPVRMAWGVGHPLLRVSTEVQATNGTLLTMDATFIGSAPMPSGTVTVRITGADYSEVWLGVIQQYDTQFIEVMTLERANL